MRAQNSNSNSNSNSNKAAAEAAKAADKAAAEAEAKAAADKAAADKAAAEAEAKAAADKAAADKAAAAAKAATDVVYTPEILAAASAEARAKAAAATARKAAKAATLASVQKAFGTEAEDQAAATFTFFRAGCDRKTALRLSKVTIDAKAAIGKIVLTAQHGEGKAADTAEAKAAALPHRVAAAEAKAAADKAAEGK